MKMVILDGYALNPGDLDWKGLAAFGELRVLDRTPYDAKQIVEAIGGAELIFTNKTPLPREVLLQVPSVRYIGVLATGFNIVDLDTASEMGITVTNIPSYSTLSVAQFTMALLLEMCHHVGEHHRAVQQGDWSRSKDFSFRNYPLIELAGKTMGLIGYGRIGEATAHLAEAFGMKILTSGSRRQLQFRNKNSRQVALEELLRDSDVISLHCPLTPDTEGIINIQTLSQMKEGVMIINTSRGPLIVESDLKAALESGKVAYAAVDVVSQEPIDPNNPLLQAPNCIITPHIAWAPIEARSRLLKTAVDNLTAFMAGNPINVVNR